MTSDAADPASAVLIACCQIELRARDQWHNRAATQHAIETAAQAGASIIVLPELANSGYVFHSIAEARTVAEPAEGTTVTAWSQLARQYSVTIVGGFCEQGTDGNLYNSAVLLDDHGPRAIYRKAHLWDHETTLFTPGDNPPPVVESAGHRIGVLLCYDLDFAEWPRAATVAGAELLCVPVNWPDYGQVHGPQPMELVRARAAASVNHVFIAACDRVGAERGVTWIGQSAILDPEGWVLTAAEPNTSECLLLTSCTPSTAANKQISDNNDLLHDRRPELYATVALEVADDAPSSTASNSNAPRA